MGPWSQPHAVFTCTEEERTRLDVPQACRFPSCCPLEGNSSLCSFLASAAGGEELSSSRRRTTDAVVTHPPPSPARFQHGAHVLPVKQTGPQRGYLGAHPVLFTHGSIAVWAHLPPRGISVHESNEKACSLNGQCTGSQSCLTAHQLPQDSTGLRPHCEQSTAILALQSLYGQSPLPVTASPCCPLLPVPAARHCQPLLPTLPADPPRPRHRRKGRPGGAQRGPPARQGCSQAGPGSGPGSGSGLSFLTAGCHLALEGPGAAGPLRREGPPGQPRLPAAPARRGWSPGLLLDGGGLLRRERSIGRVNEVGLLKGSLRHIHVSPMLPRTPKVWHKDMCVMRCSGCPCADRCPPSSPQWPGSASTGPAQRAIGDPWWREGMKVRPAPASVPPALVLVCKYWAAG